MRSSTICLLFVAALATTAVGQLSGTYTIKPDSTGDFLSFSHAAAALRTQGVGGHCVFEAYTGTYASWIYLLNVAPDSWTVTFRPATGQQVVIQSEVSGVNSDNMKWEGLTFRYDNSCFWLEMCSGWRIERCTIETDGRYAVRVEDDDRSTCDSVIGCHITAGQDGLFTEGLSHYIVNNFIAFDRSKGVELRESEDPHVVCYNTIVATSDNVDYCLDTGGSRMMILNNIMCLGPDAGYEACCLYAPDAEEGDFVSDYNCFWVEGMGFDVECDSGWVDLPAWQSMGFGLHSIAQDPRLVDTSDLHLQSSSPCIDRGTPVPGILTDIDGDARDSTPDIGADEYVPSAVGRNHGTVTKHEEVGTTFVRSGLTWHGQGEARLHDITGRKAMDLSPGPNDIRHLGPGVYFVRRSGDNSTTKVVVQH